MKKPSHCKTTVQSLCLLLAVACGAASSAAAAQTGIGLEASWEQVLADGALEEPWINTLGDPGLEKIVVEALRHSRQLTTAGENLRQSEQLASQANAALAAAITSRGGAEIFGTVAAAGNLQWQLDVWQRLGAAAADGFAYAAVETDLEAARQSLGAQAAKAWLLAHETNLQLALSQRVIEIHQQALQIVSDRVAAGDAAATDTEAAETSLAIAGENQRRLVGALVHALRGIAVLIGRFPSAELAEVREYVPEPVPLPTGISAALLERRADLRAAARDVRDAFRQKQSAAVAGLPRLPLTGNNGAASAELQRLLATGNGFFTRAENFLVARDSGVGSGSGETTLSAQQQTALNNYAGVAERAFREIANALASDTRLAQRAAHLAASVDAIATQLAASSGSEVAITANMLQSQLLALQSRIGLVRVQYALLAQRIDLHLALGGGFED